MPYADPIQYKKYQKEYRKKNLNKFLEYRKSYYQEHKEKAIQDAQLWPKLKTEEYKLSRKKWHHKVRNQILELLGGECLYCGFDDWRALQVDHVNGGGTKERKTYGHTPSVLLTKILKSVNEGKNEYQLLCANCNWIKRVEKGEHCGKIN